jgi:hypothetical protein
VLLICSSGVAGSRCYSWLFYGNETMQKCADIQILRNDAVLYCAAIFCAAVAVAVAAAAVVAGCCAAVTEWRKRFSHTLECNGYDSIVILGSRACHSHRSSVNAFLQKELNFGDKLGLR